VRADFDTVIHDVTKLRAHLQGVCIEAEYAEGQTTQAKEVAR
jgi:hypothetical protein